MAKSAAEKAAYNREYYQNYKKKGLKKGRKKSSKKSSTKTVSLLGTSISGVNDEGRMQAALIKEKLKKEMNEALKSAKTDEEKEKIRMEYSRKAIEQINALKSDPQYAKAKTGSSKGSRSGSKSSGSKSSGSSKSSGNSGSSKNTTSKVTSQATYDNSTELAEDTMARLSLQADSLMKMAKSMPPAMKKRVAATVESLLEQLKILRGE